MTISESVADIIAKTGYEAIPASVVDNAKKLILDHLGVAAVGSTMPWGIIVNKVARSMAGEGKAAIYFSQNRVGPTTAALVNGTYAHGFELDDNLWSVHPGCTVIPAAFAAAELRGGVDGRTFLTAVILGYEVMVRVAKAVGSEMSEAGHHPTGTTGQFGAAVAAGKILGLDQDALVSALGLAGDFPTGRCEFFRGTMDKRIFAGRAAEAGILACLLAREGFTGPRTIFEGEYGFCHTVSDSVNVDLLLEGLGEQFYIERIITKRYACAGGIHPFIDAASVLREQSLEAVSDFRNISEIVIGGPKRALNTRRTELAVNDVMTAQYSIPYGVVTALRCGQPGPDEFLEPSIRAEGTQALLKCCRLVTDDNPASQAWLTVKLNDGTELGADVVNTNMAVADRSREEIVGKFLRLTAGVGFQMDALVELVDSVDTLSDVSQVTETLALTRRTD